VKIGDGGSSVIPVGIGLSGGAVAAVVDVLMQAQSLLYIVHVPLNAVVAQVDEVWPQPVVVVSGPHVFKELGSTQL